MKPRSNSEHEQIVLQQMKEAIEISETEIKRRNPYKNNQVSDPRA